ncbi:MAG: rhodanese-like domain-containing protein [bacterium]
MLQRKLKQLLFFILFFLSTSATVLIFYFLFFYFPLKNNQEIFPAVENSEIFIKEDIPEDMQKMYGITYEDARKEKMVYFIDGREKEEYDIFRFKNATHLRAPDISSVKNMMDALNTTSEEFNNSLIVIYCHDGRRSLETVSKINLPNVKFLIGGRKNFLTADPSSVEGDSEKSPFPNHIKDYDFTITLSKFKNIISNDYFLVNGRINNDDNLFPDVYQFRIGYLTTKEYNEKIKDFIGQKNKNIVIIANSYPDLFYAKLLIYRLEMDYGFDYKKFNIVFGQDKNISKIINE